MKAVSLRFWCVVGCVAALAATSSAAAAAPHRARPSSGTPVPQRFVGVNVNGPMLSFSGTALASQLDKMVASGVTTIRVPFYWSNAQPYQTWSDVPSDQVGNFTDVHGVPTDFTLTDAIVGAAATHRLTVLPMIVGAPAWDAQPNPHGIATPMTTQPYADYLTALVTRYGPKGTFWDGHVRRLPIRMWQIWNEPNIQHYWTQPFAPTYVPLLRAAHAAIKHADPGAVTVLAALTNWSWNSLAQIYAVQGGRGSFDVVGLDPYTSTPKNVIRILTLVRRTLDSFGDFKKPILATEVGWTSAVGEPCPLQSWDTTRSGQARKIARLLPLLAANRKSLHLLGFYYYTWMSDEAANTYDFNFAGLLSYQNGTWAPKPALGAFSRAARLLER